MGIYRKKNATKKTQAKKDIGGKLISHGDEYKAKLKNLLLEESGPVYKSRIRAIGNSKGVIINSSLIEKAGLNPDAEIEIQAADGILIIIQAKKAEVNTDLSLWDMEFKKAIHKGRKPEADLFERAANDFDSKEW